MKQYDDYLYKEVFVVGVDHLTTDGGELTVHRSFEDVVDYLATKSVGINSDLRAVHGVLTSARSIPKDLCSRQAFILIADPGNDGYGMLIDSDSDECQELAVEIEKLLTNEEIAVSFAEIDNVYILYGYELEIILSIDEESLDEELISSCASVAIRAKELENSKED